MPWSLRNSRNHLPSAFLVTHIWHFAILPLLCSDGYITGKISWLLPQCLSSSYNLSRILASVAMNRGRQSVAQERLWSHTCELASRELFDTRSVSTHPLCLHRKDVFLPSIEVAQFLPPICLFSQPSSLSCTAPNLSNRRKKMLLRQVCEYFFIQHFSNLQVLPLRFIVRTVSEVCIQWNWLGKGPLGITEFCDLGRKPPVNRSLIQMNNLIMHIRTFLNLHNWSHR